MGPQTVANMSLILKELFSSWGAVGSSQAFSNKFTLKMYDKYHSFEAVDNPNGRFDITVSLINGLKSISTQNSSATEIYLNFMTGFMAHAIFGSNMQEKAGLSLEDTITICLKVFHGFEILPDEIDRNEHRTAVDWLISQGYPSPSIEDIIKARREVIQHAKAVTFFVGAILRNEKLSEKLICDTHRILCEAIPSYNGHNDYAGQYRTVDAMAGGTLFTPPHKIHGEMKSFIKDFEQDTKNGNGENPGEMDPFFLAADMCQDFVTIHPFLDGNGRMCRLIANAYLLKYTGIVISIGEDELDRKEYLEIASYAGDGETEERARGTLANFFLRKGDVVLRRLEEALKVED